VTGVIRNSSASEKCPGCNGTGAPLIVAGDPTSGHDLNKTCGVCGGSGFVKAERKT
jgi:DnaJ-class molecular chaperone